MNTLICYKKFRKASYGSTDEGEAGKIIFLNRFYYPDHSATSQLLTDLATALASKGMCVEVITSRLSYDDRGTRLAREETVSGVKITRIATSGLGRGNLFGRALDYLTFYIAAAWSLFRRARRGDIIVTKTDPPMLSVIAAPIARMRGALLINWLQDIFPEVAQALDVGGGWLGRSIFSALKIARDASLKSAHLNVVLGERMATHVTARSGATTQVRVIPNWADGQLIRPTEPRVQCASARMGPRQCFRCRLFGQSRAGSRFPHIP